MTATEQGAAGKRRPGRPRKADALDTKVTLQQAALRLFAQSGYAGTSIRAIASAVGLSESVLYAHFPNKQAIFDAVLDEFGPRSSADVLDRVDPDLATADPARYLYELVRAFLAEWDQPDARLLISLMARDGLLHTPALREALAAMRTATARLFDRWATAGRIPSDLGSPEDLAMSFTGPIGLLRILHLHADATDQERAAASEQILRHVEIFTQAVFRTSSVSRTSSQKST